MEQKIKIYSELRKNENYIRDKFKNCADILIRPMRLGNESKVDCLIVYIEVAVSNMMLDDSALGKMINHFWESSSYQIQEFVQNNSLGIADVRKADADAAVLQGVDSPGRPGDHQSRKAFICGGNDSPLRGRRLLLLSEGR